MVLSSEVRNTTGTVSEFLNISETIRVSLGLKLIDFEQSAE